MIDGPLSVKWFGAKGDNSQDDQPGIQAAVEAAAAWVASGRGAVVFFPPGEYQIQDSIVLRLAVASGPPPGRRCCAVPASTTPV
jgi:polygalacturonase